MRFVDIDYVSWFLAPVPTGNDLEFYFFIYMFFLEYNIARCL